MAINKSLKRPAQTTITKETYEKLEALAKEERRSLSSLIAIIIEDFLKKKEKGNQL